MARRRRRVRRLVVFQIVVRRFDKPIADFIESAQYFRFGQAQSHNASRAGLALTA